MTGSYNKVLTIGKVIDSSYEELHEQPIKVELNLDNIDIDMLIDYVNKVTDLTFIERDRLEKVKEIEKTFSPLTEIFDKHSIEGIRKQECIEKFILIIENANQT